MAMIDCPECGSRISDKAEACPHCGNPIAAKPARRDGEKHSSEGKHSSAGKHSSEGKHSSKPRRSERDYDERPRKSAPQQVELVNLKGSRHFNTNASPKSKKVCEIATLFPFAMLLLTLVVAGICMAINPNSEEPPAIFMFLMFITVFSTGSASFYLGKFGKGFLYLFTFGLFGIGLIIDLISLWMNTFTDKLGLPVLYD